MPNPWLMPDDGIVDEVAAAGLRKVRLTAIERQLAAALILAMGHGTRMIVSRLGVTDRTACLLAQVAQTGYPAGMRRRNEIAADELLAGRTAAAV